MTAALFLISAVVTGSLVSTLAKRVFDRARPDLVNHMDVTFTSSFPSAHAMVGALTWLTLAAVAVRFVSRPALRVFILVGAVTIALMVGITRVYLGVHWPTDVLAGWLFGAAWAGMCWMAANMIGRTFRRRNELGQTS
nr:phosphatase PAP2 family protein [Pseudohoeflea sp. DP4N28-3]